MRIKEKQIKALKILKYNYLELKNEDAVLEYQLNEENKVKIEISKKKEKMVNRKNLIYEITKYVYNFRQI